MNATRSLNIGILTFHRCINYGSYWQVRCLVEGIQKRGHHVEILDHHSARVNRAEWKCAMQPVLPTAVPSSDRPLYRQKIEKFFKAFSTLSLSQPFPLEYPSQMKDYDLVIVGSDEVWNLSHPWYGYYPVFYGEGIRAGRLISYAASFGNHDVTWRLAREWVERLHKFDKISVRDENSQSIIRNTLGFDPEVVLDPCLQFPPEDNKNEMLYAYRPYVAVYGHNFSPFFTHHTKRWAGDRKLPLISIGYRNEWADEQWLSADPLEFASFISQSAAVVTNFFHGCVFALINSKPFVCEISAYRSHKVTDLMKRIDGERHLITEVTAQEDYRTCLEEPLDEKIFLNIAMLRETSDAFLDQALIPQLASYQNV